MSMRIMICDDHPLFREGLAAALQNEPDIEIAVQAGSVGELRASIGGVDVDLLLLDIDLPDESGASVVTEFADTTTVLIISALDDPNVVREVMRDGAIGFVRKDTDPVELLRLCLLYTSPSPRD